MHMRLSPPRVVLLSFAAAILIGSAVLSLPGMTAAPGSLAYIDALFTAASAVCVTGLITVDTATVFTPLGKAVIAILIQLGGLGIMTAATMLFLLARRRIGLQGRLVIQETLGHLRLAGVVRLVLAILLMTLVFEGVGTLILAGDFLLHHGYSPLRALGYGAFHSISAFNNAGFALFTNSLEGFRDDWVVTLTVACLIIGGGLGFPVILDLARPRKGRIYALQTKMVILVTAGLLSVGTLAFLALEWTSPELAGLGAPGRVLVAFFQAVTPRTAGFNTVPIAGLAPGTIFLFIILMFIGASPESTGGGIKTTTFGIIAASMRATFRGAGDTEFASRRIGQAQVTKALTLVVASAVFILVMTLLLLDTGQDIPLDTGLFEVVSAFGTVGLSLGLTSKLTMAGKVVIILTMYAGRVGTLTVGAALIARRRPAPRRLPEEALPTG
ncbi:MAG TPA: potassium transporter TrkG [Thermoleophilia bacterium]|nr:potassium transporter TrkG [Thermoleophilia bacterium]